MLRIDDAAFGSLFIEPDEVPERHGVRHVGGFGERIEAEGVFEPNDENGDASLRISSITADFTDMASHASDAP